MKEIRALRDSFSKMSERQKRTERQMKLGKGKCRGRKSSRSSDLSSSEPEDRYAPKRRFRTVSSSMSSYLDSEVSNARDRKLVLGAALPIDAAIPDRVNYRIWRGKFRYLLDPEVRPILWAHPRV